MNQTIILWALGAIGRYSGSFIVWLRALAAAKKLGRAVPVSGMRRQLGALDLSHFLTF